MSDLIVPGRDVSMRMSLAAFRKIAAFVLEHPMRPGDNFTITGTDKKRLVILLES